MGPAQPQGRGDRTPTHEDTRWDGAPVAPPPAACGLRRARGGRRDVARRSGLDSPETASLRGHSAHARLTAALKFRLVSIESFQVT